MCADMSTVEIVGPMVIEDQSSCCGVADEEIFKVFCEDVDDELLAGRHLYYPDEEVCHKVDTRRTRYFSDDTLATRVGEPDYYVVDTLGSKADCCLNIGDYPDNE